MASSLDFVTWVCDQIAGTGDVRFKKMFGEYMVYVDEKPLLLVCNDTVFVKQLDCVAALLHAAPVGTPYNGAKPHYMLDIDHRNLACAVVQALLPVVPIPKPRKPKKLVQV